MHNKAFGAALLAAALPSIALAQLPRECFYVEDLHGPEIEDSSLLSNLVSLMAMYKPGMRVSQVMAFQDDLEDSTTKLAGISLNLKQPGNDSLDEGLELPSIKEIGLKWRLEAYDFDEGQPDRINIRTDEFGVCDVVLSQGTVETSLAMENSDCTADSKDTIINLPEETPLVGLHGKVDMFGITQLGLILVDTLDPVCREPMKDAPNMWIYEAMDDFTAADYSEAQITGQERQRAQALEAILMDESLHNVHKTKKEIREAIEAMHDWAPIQLKENGNPVDMEQLAILLERLMELEVKNAPATREELATVMDQIVDFYTANEIEDAYPINIGVYQEVEAELDQIDGLDSPGWMLAGRNPKEPARTQDLIDLLSLLSKHYMTADPDQIEDDLAQMEDFRLVDIFDSMCTYYTIGDGWDRREAPDMWSLFDFLAEVYGQKSDWDLDDDELEALYQQMEEGPLPDDTFFEGSKVSTFEDLLAREREDREAQINGLLGELYDYEEIVMEDQELMRSYLDANEVGNVDALFKTMKEDFPADEFMSEKDFEDFINRAQDNKDDRDDDINPYNYFGSDDYNKENTKDIEIEMLLDRIQEQDARLIDLEASVDRNTEWSINDGELERMDIDDVREDIAALKELANKNQGKIDIFDQSSVTKEDLLKLEEDKERLDAILSQLKADTPGAEKVTNEQQEEANGAINQSLAVVTTLVASLVIGSLLGCMCLYCVMKCTRKAGRVPSGLQFEGDSQEPAQNERRIVRQQSSSDDIGATQSAGKRSNRSRVPAAEAPLQTLPNNQIMDTQECEGLEDAKPTPRGLDTNDDHEDIENALRLKHGERYEQTSFSKKLGPPKSAKKLPSGQDALDISDQMVKKLSQSVKKTNV